MYVRVVPLGGLEFVEKFQLDHIDYYIYLHFVCKTNCCQLHANQCEYRLFSELDQ